ELKSAQIQLSSNETGDSVDGNDAEQTVAQNPWQTGVYQGPSKEGEPSEAEVPTQQSQPRRSTRVRKTNPKYANDALAEEAVEPETFEEASQNSMWIKSMEEEIAALERSQTWELVAKLRDMKELGQLKHFLGLEIDRTQEGIFLHQQKYSKDLLKKFGMSRCKPISIPIEPNAKICAHAGKDLEDATMYQQLVGSLIYLTLTRPDISYAIGVMSREKVLQEEIGLQQIKTEDQVTDLFTKVMQCSQATRGRSHAVSAPVGGGHSGSNSPSKRSVQVESSVASVDGSSEKIVELEVQKMKESEIVKLVRLRWKKRMKEKDLQQAEITATDATEDGNDKTFDKLGR
ncbi:hypothetical protein RJ639_019296, partial [Escallonia herrerae]